MVRVAGFKVRYSRSRLSMPSKISLRKKKLIKFSGACSKNQDQPSKLLSDEIQEADLLSSGAEGQVIIQMCLVAILEATNYSQYHEKPTITPNITSPQLHPISQEEAHNYKKRPSCMNIFTRLASLSTVYPTSIPKEKKKP